MFSNFIDNILNNVLIMYSGLQYNLSMVSIMMSDIIEKLLNSQLNL